MSSATGVHAMKPSAAAASRGKNDAAGRKFARDKVFEVAADLFYRQGVRAVGVDTIVKQAGVAKFQSLPELCLEGRADRRLSAGPQR